MRPHLRLTKLTISLCAWQLILKALLGRFKGQ